MFQVVQALVMVVIGTISFAVDLAMQDAVDHGRFDGV